MEPDFFTRQCYVCGTIRADALRAYGDHMLCAPACFNAFASTTLHTIPVEMLVHIRSTTTPARLTKREELRAHVDDLLTQPLRVKPVKPMTAAELCALAKPVPVHRFWQFPRGRSGRRPRGGAGRARRHGYRGSAASSRRGFTGSHAWAPSERASGASIGGGTG